MKELMKKFAGEESGQGLVEYALIIVLIAVVAIVAVKTLGTKVGDIFGQITDGLDGKTTTPDPDPDDAG